MKQALVAGIAGFTFLLGFIAGVVSNWWITSAIMQPAHAKEDRLRPAYILMLAIRDALHEKWDVTRFISEIESYAIEFSIIEQHDDWITIVAHPAGEGNLVWVAKLKTNDLEQIVDAELNYEVNRTE